MQEGENNNNSKYTLWNSNKVRYSKKDLMGNVRYCHPNYFNLNNKGFTVKYNNKVLKIGTFLTPFECENIHNLIRGYLKNEDVSENVMG